MVYDQAQSPRLGQRTPVESTYVEIFDVDPGTPTPDLVEAAWPGQLVYRKDLGTLSIYDEEIGAWIEIRGGTGSATYVGSTMPPGSGYNTGDVWYDTGHDYALYVWDATTGQWEASAAVGGIHTYRTDVDENGNPIGDVIPPGSELMVGDLWIRGEEGNRTYRWNGLDWEDIQDAQTAQNAADITANQNAIAATNLAVENTNAVAYSAQNAADTADGRVSMSDYEPGPDDLTYTVYKNEVDPITGEPIVVEYQVSRNEGSIWFTRTRERTNVCSNPSFEIDDTDWGTVGASLSVVTAPSAIDGLKVAELANSGSGAHWLVWEPRQPAAEGNIWTVSVFCSLVTGSGAGVYLEIVWCDATDTEIGTAAGSPLQLDPTWTDQGRPWVSALAPVGTASFYPRVVNPNHGDVWRADGMLIERTDDLGRYFDGDSTDGYWGEWDEVNEVATGAPNASTSGLHGDKITRVFELRDNDWVRKYFTDDTQDDMSAAKITRDWMSGERISDGSLTPVKDAVQAVIASEPLSAGDIVNVWSSGGYFRARRANAASRYEGHGYVMHDYAVNDEAKVYFTGYNAYQTGLLPGTVFLSSTPGKVSGQPPTSIGSLVQRLGWAAGPGILNFVPLIAVRIT